MRTVILALAVAAAVAACGGGTKLSAPPPSSATASTSHSNATTTRHGSSTSTATPKPTYNYPASVKKSFMGLCLRKGSRSTCECTLNWLEDNYSFARLKAVSIRQVVVWELKAASICSQV